MNGYLLDTNVLIALLWPSHARHDVLGLALRRGGRLATLDERIAALAKPKSDERKALEFVA